MRLFVRMFGSWVLSTCMMVPQSLQSQTVQPDDAGRLVLQAQARTVVLDVVVSGKNGAGVAGLRKEDFEVTEEGHAQAITSFEEHPGARTPPAAQPALPPGVFTNIPRGVPEDAVTVLLFDGLNTQLADQTYVRREMFRYLENPLPGKRMAIFTLGTQLRYVQGFTDDPAVLAAALKNLKSGAAPETSPLLPSALDGNGLAQMASIGLDSGQGIGGLQTFLKEQAVSQENVRVVMTLEAFQQLARYLGGIPGRKNVAWFSGAFPISLSPNGGLSEKRDLGEELKKTNAALAAARVAVYPIAAEGLAPDSINDAGAQMVVHSAQDAQIQQTKTLQNDSTQRNGNHAAMDDIASDTGGEAYYNRNALYDGLRQVEDRGSHYYTLSYTPSDRASDGRFRKIRVKLASGNYRLAYRRGYYAPSAKSLKQAAGKQPGDPLRPCMGPGMPGCTEIPMAVRVVLAGREGQEGGKQTAKSPQAHYVADFVIASRGLALDAAADGSRHGKVEAMLMVFDARGRALNWLVREVDLDMDAARYQQVQRDGVNFRMEIDAPGEGVSLRSGVYDLNSKLTGTLELPLRAIGGAGAGSQ